VTIEQESNIADAAVVLAALVVGAVLVVGAALTTLVGADPPACDAAVGDVVDEPQAAIKSATTARTAPMRRT
jgi:hypothetical protein